MAGRRRQRRRLHTQFDEYFFKPAGIPLRVLDIEKISDEELEALRLQYIEGMKQIKAAKMMGISQSQFQRDVDKAIVKIARALIQGKAIDVKRVPKKNQ